MSARAPALGRQCAFGSEVAQRTLTPNSTGVRAALFLLFLLPFPLGNESCRQDQGRRVVLLKLPRREHATAVGAEALQSVLGLDRGERKLPWPK